MTANLPGATVAVILPHRGCEQHLPGAVGSILGQSHRDLALFVVDDSSPGEGWRTALAPFLSDPRLHVFQTDRCVGPYRIKNHLIARSRSVFVGFQDADDRSHPDRIAAQIAFMERWRLDLAGCGFRVVDERGAVVRRRRMRLLANLAHRLGATFLCHHPASLVRRQVFDVLGGFDGSTTIAADSDFHLRAAHLFRISNVPRPLYDYRDRPDSLSRAAATGHGSEPRRVYAERMLEREAARRAARTRSALLPLLRAPENDIEFRLTPWHG
jgi:glycosyltransferase involved in cell wall biosynthesis